MQKNISKDVSKEDVLSILKDGFDSGEFCKDIGHLAGPAKMRKHVKDQLRVKYDVPKKSLKQIIGGIFKKKGKVDELCEDDGKEKFDLSELDETTPISHPPKSELDGEGDDL